MDKLDPSIGGEKATASEQLDITIVQEDSFDESQASTEDLNHTLQEELALRKNLDIAFADTQSSAKPAETASIQQKIAHFERRFSKQPVASVKPPPVPSRALPNTKGFAPAASTDKSVMAASDKTSSKRLKVFLRLRPCTESVVEVVSPDLTAANVAAAAAADGHHKANPTKIRTYPAEDSSSSRTGRKEVPKEYEFTEVFGQDSTQLQVYAKTAAPLVNQLCSGNRVGNSALLFSYGITNAGKTHTVLGDVRHKNTESWGIVPRCILHVLEKVNHTDLKVSMSYFEIYNEMVYDLLPRETGKKTAFQTQTKPLKIRERGGQTLIKGLTKHPIDSLEGGLAVIRKAKESRHTATNHLNRHSSRSHCICQITVSLNTQELESAAAADDDSSVDTASMMTGRPEDSAALWIVDLAGSERSKRTNVGSLRQKEASFINKSLMTLMGCLTRGEKNYRDSKLTMLFMHHWMKSGTTTMIVNVHPSRDDYDETQHVLAYAISTKTIPNVERRNVTASTGGGNAFVYGYDGRRKDGNDGNKNNKKAAGKIVPLRKVQAGRKRKSDASSTAPLPNKAAGLQKKGPSSLKPADAQPSDMPRAKKQKREELPSDTRKQLELALAQNEKLKAHKKMLERKLETIETTVRAEVADEMLKETTSMTKRYEGTVRELKAQLAASQGEDQKVNLRRAQAKVDELLEQIEECEEEMLRMTESHNDETQKGVEAMAAKDKEIALLRRELEESQAKIETLRKSKEELVKSYEKLLTDDAEEDEEMQGSESPPSRRPAGGGHYKKRLQCRTEPRPRRPLGIKRDASQLDNNGDKTTATKTRQPLGDRSVNMAHNNSKKGELLLPTKPVKKDPKTGAFMRPNGSAPLGVSEWDEKVGAWRKLVGGGE